MANQRPRVCALRNALFTAAFTVGVVCSVALGENPLRETKDGKPMRQVKFEKYRIQLDLSKQRLGIDIPEDRSFGEARGRHEAPIQPTLAGASGGIVSASVLAQKAKQFDDGLYAAIDLAAQSGVGQFAGKKQLLESLAQALSDRASGPGSASLEVIYSAARLGNLAVKNPASLNSATDRRVRGFLADELRSKPIGFYTWSKPLEAIFQQDRMLQTELEGQSGIEAITRALHADKSRRATYEGYLKLVSGLTNPLAKPDLRNELAQLDKGSIDPPARGRYFFPPSVAHETELVKRLYGDRPIPEGFNLANTMIEHIRSGKIQLEPRPESGWYDYQTWSLEPMVIPEKMSEAKYLEFSESYRKQLLELFKGILALTRETHIKQLEIPAPGAAARPPVERKVVPIYPELSAEPLPTYYARRAVGYRFIRTVLRDTFGTDALRQLHRITADAPVEASLSDELDAIESLFTGAYVTLSRELGMALVGLPGESANPPDADAKRFAEWSRAVGDDTDVARDARMMVPVFYDVQRRKTKVWVFLGWSARPVTVYFATAPTAQVFDESGNELEKPPLDLQFHSTHQALPYPVTAEVYVTKILNRAEFRKHCDQYKTQEAILKNLN